MNHTKTSRLKTPLLVSLIVGCLSGAVPGTASLARADESADVTRLIKNGQFDQALTRADAFLAGKPRDPQMRFLKGLVLTEQGKAAEAIKVFTRLTEDYPELPEPYNNLAVLYASQAQFEKARQSLEMAIRTHPSYATAYENLGDVYSKLASQSYDKALQLDSNNPTAEMKLSMVRELITGKSRAPAPAPAPAVVAAAPAAVQVASAPAPTPAAPVAPVAQAAKVAAITAASSITAATTAAAAPVAAAVSPTPAPAPMASVGSPSNKANDGDVMQSIRDWAEAWSKQDIDAYLSFYGSDFDPASNQSRTAWEKERRSRIGGKARIEVRVDSPIIVYDSDKATVQFKQTYISDRFTNVSIKTLVLAKSGNRWLIQREKSSS